MQSVHDRIRSQWRWLVPITWWPCLLTCLGCLRRRTRSIDLQDVLYCVAVTTSLRDIWVSLTIWSAQRSGGRPPGRRHYEGGVEVRMSMAWVPGCRWQMCPKVTDRRNRLGRRGSELTRLSLRYDISANTITGARMIRWSRDAHCITTSIMVTSRRRHENKQRQHPPADMLSCPIRKGYAWNPAIKSKKRWDKRQKHIAIVRLVVRPRHLCNVQTFQMTSTGTTEPLESQNTSQNANDNPDTLVDK